MKEQIKQIKEMKKEYKQALQVIKGVQLTRKYKMYGTTENDLKEKRKIIEEEIKKIDKKIEENKEKGK